MKKLILIFAISLSFANQKKGVIDMHGGKSYGYGGFNQNLKQKQPFDKNIDHNRTNKAIKF